MAVLCLTDAYISIASNDISSSCYQVGLDAQVDDLDITTFGSTWKGHKGGLKAGTLAIAFRQDFAASAIDSIIWPLLGTSAAFEIRPTSSAVGSSNPKWTGSVVITSYAPLGNSVGELAVVTVSWPTTGTVTRATS